MASRRRRCDVRRRSRRRSSRAVVALRGRAQWGNSRGGSSPPLLGANVRKSAPRAPAAPVPAPDARTARTEATRQRGALVHLEAGRRGPGAACDVCMRDLGVKKRRGPPSAPVTWVRCLTGRSASALRAGRAARRAGSPLLLGAPSPHRRLQLPAVGPGDSRRRLRRHDARGVAGVGLQGWRRRARPPQKDEDHRAPEPSLAKPNLAVSVAAAYLFGYVGHRHLIWWLRAELRVPAPAKRGDPKLRRGAVRAAARPPPPPKCGVGEGTTRVHLITLPSRWRSISSMGLNCQKTTPREGDVRGGARESRRTSVILTYGLRYGLRKPIRHITHL